MEEGLPRLEREQMQQVAKNYTVTTVVGCDGFWTS